jgi:hypothetical protein
MRGCVRFVAQHALIEERLADPVCWCSLVCLISAAITIVGLLDSSHAQTARGKKCALLVGVCEYDSSALQALDYPENDVEELSKLLNTPAAGFASVRVLTNKRGGNDAESLGPS